MLAAPLVRRDDVSDAERLALAGGALLAELTGTVRFELTGTGRVQVLQGMVTCDVEKTGGAPSVFGALLTSRGAIVSLLWIYLLDDRIVLEAPAAAAETLREVFTRTMPPRLCKARDVTGETGSILSFGPRPAGIEGAPAVAHGTGGVIGTVAGAGEAARMVDAAVRQGAVRASDALLERCRIEALVPRLGAEIDERTLPQEAGLEALGAISYSKGCYIGQETVARLHFRGHANRRLVSVDLDDEPAALNADLFADGKPVGRLTSAAWSDAANGWIGLAVVRKEVADGALLEGAAGVTVRGQRRLREP